MEGALIIPLFCIWWVLYDASSAQKRIAEALERIASRLETPAHD